MANKNNRVKTTNDIELKDRLVAINRVTKVTKGGRTFTFAAIVVVGNEDGIVGWGLGKANEVTAAIAKGVEAAKKNLIRVPVHKGSQVLCLIKPQFEAGKDKVGKKGVVRDPQTHQEVLDQFVALAHELGFHILGLTFSPVKGPEGNIEFLGHLSLEDLPEEYPQTAQVVAQAHRTLDQGAER